MFVRIRDSYLVPRTSNLVFKRGEARPKGSFNRDTRFPILIISLDILNHRCYKSGR